MIRIPDSTGTKPKPTDVDAFPPINRAYNSVFRNGRLSVGLVLPLEAYPAGPVPNMEAHLERVQLAEAPGFSAV